MDVFDLFAKLSLDTSQYDSQLASVKSGVSAITGTIGRIGAASAVAVGAMATAVGGLASQAVSAYGSFEQLIGGIETLFGNDVSVQVLENASNAYKTAGMSANDYMNTVINMAASLNKATGDTEESARLADVAVTDMADNVNKMGTNMEMVQNAYRGFTRSNFTMLDNLALGYAGTKEGMSELLADAEKISGIKYDISSYADIVNAIHVVQTEMGITGTTSKEAAGTITGSLSSVKAAWDNLVTGLADPSADLGALIDNVVSTASAAFGNLAPTIEQAVLGIGSLIEQVSPVLAEGLPTMINNLLPGLTTAVTQLITSLSQALPTLLPTLVEQILPTVLTAATDLLSGLFTALVDTLPTVIPLLLEFLNELVNLISTNASGIVEAGAQIVTTLAEGITQSLPTLIPAVVEMILYLFDAFLDNVDILMDASAGMMEALAEGIVNYFPILIEKAPAILLKFVQALIRNAPKMQLAAIQMMITLANGVLANIPKLLGVAIKVVSALVAKFGELASKFIDVGKNIVKGIWEGISGAYDWIVGKLEGWVDNVLAYIKKLFKIESPSKVMRDEVGKFLALGLVEGFTDEDPLGQIENEISNAYGKMRPALEIPVTTQTADVPQRSEISSLKSAVQSLADRIDSLTVNVALEGDAQGIFNVVEKQNNIAKRKRGYGLA